MNFQKFLWVIAGAEPSILENCKTDHKKYSSIGATILMTSFIAFCAGTCAAWYFTQNGDEVNGALGWSVLFGLIWALLIFCIDRSLVITLKKDPTRKRQKFWIPLMSRAVLACVIAFMVSIPLELFIFKDYINENIENFKEGKAGQLGDIFKANSNEDELNNRINLNDSLSMNLQKEINGLTSKREALTDSVKALEEQKKKPKSEAYITAKQNFDNANEKYNYVSRQLDNEKGKPNHSESRIKELEEDLQNYYQHKQTAERQMGDAKREWVKTIQQQIDTLNAEINELSGDIDEKDEKQKKIIDSQLQEKKTAGELMASRRRSEEIKKEQMEKGNKFLLNFQILEYAVWQRDKNGNLTDTTQLCFLWLIRLLFFIIEILPTVVKIATSVGSYDRVVYAEEKNMEEYLDSQEFIDCMREINKSELQARLDEAKLRHEAEIQMKQEILEKMTAAQIEVADYAIAKWEESEKRRFMLKHDAKE